MSVATRDSLRSTSRHHEPNTHLLRLFAALVAIEANAQTLQTSCPAANSETNVPVVRTIAPSASTGTPLQIALDREVRVKKVGQIVQARLMQSVYASDQLVLPAGDEVNGNVARIGSPGGKWLMVSIMNADFTPTRPIEVAFDESSCCVSP